MELLDNLKDVLLITFGAVLGANIRFLIYQKLEKINLSNHHIILLINTFSSFLFGLFLSFSSQMDSFAYPYNSGLFFLIGLLGSLSTFSAFISDLYNLFIQLEFYRALRLFMISLTLGILSFAAGFLIRNA